VNQKDSDRGSEFANTVRFVFTATSLSMLQHRPDYFSRSACGARQAHVPRNRILRSAKSIARRSYSADRLPTARRAPQAV